MAILVTGCAGYIGSIACKMLIEQGFDVVGIDNLSKGYKDNIPEGVDFYKACISDVPTISSILKKSNVDGILHFAGYIEVAESVKNPSKYFQNNVNNSITFLNTVLAHEINNFIFSSSAAVYGTPKSVPIKETAELNPINPYGDSKFFIERILNSYSEAYALKYICLRYFNVAGAYGDYGECHDPETHLIPLTLDAALGVRDDIKIFGTDYSTSDGTAVRDYIHVRDLIDAHILALKVLQNSTQVDVDTKNKNLFNRAYNVGYGQGFSVREIIDTVKKVTAKDFLVKEEGRRAGDPAALVADCSEIKDRLNWSPQFNDLAKIIEDAYKHREKYLAVKA